MRLSCTYIAGVILAAPVLVISAGCDSGSDLEKPSVIKNVTPENDMPGFKKMQEQMKKEGKK